MEGTRAPDEGSTNAHPAGNFAPPNGSGQQSSSQVDFQGVSSRVAGGFSVPLMEARAFQQLLNNANTENYLQQGPLTAQLTEAHFLREPFATEERNPRLMSQSADDRRGQRTPGLSSHHYSQQDAMGRGGMQGMRAYHTPLNYRGHLANNSLPHWNGGIPPPPAMENHMMMPSVPSIEQMTMLPPPAMRQTMMPPAFPFLHSYNRHLNHPHHNGYVDPLHPDWSSRNMNHEMQQQYHYQQIMHHQQQQQQQQEQQQQQVYQMNQRMFGVTNQHAQNVQPHFPQNENTQSSQNSVSCAGRSISGDTTTVGQEVQVKNKADNGNLTAEQNQKEPSIAKEIKTETSEVQVKVEALSPTPSPVLPEVAEPISQEFSIEMTTNSLNDSNGDYNSNNVSSNQVKNNLINEEQTQKEPTVDKDIKTEIPEMRTDMETPPSAQFSSFPLVVGPVSLELPAMQAQSAFNYNPDWNGLASDARALPYQRPLPVRNTASSHGASMRMNQSQTVSEISLGAIWPTHLFNRKNPKPERIMRGAETRRQNGEKKKQVIRKRVATLQMNRGNPDYVQPRDRRSQMKPRQRSQRVPMPVEKFDSSKIVGPQHMTTAMKVEDMAVRLKWKAARWGTDNSDRDIEDVVQANNDLE